MEQINNSACLAAYEKFIAMAESWRRSVLAANQMPWIKNMNVDDLFSHEKIEKAREAYYGIYEI